MFCALHIHARTHTHTFLSFEIPQAVLAGQQVCSNYHLCCLRPWRAPNCLAGAEELGIMNLPYTTAQPPERPRFGRPRSHSMCRFCSARQSRSCVAFGESYVRFPQFSFVSSTNSIYRLNSLQQLQPPKQTETVPYEKRVVGMFFLFSYWWLQCLGARKDEPYPNALDALVSQSFWFCLTLLVFYLCSFCTSRLTKKLTSLGCRLPAALKRSFPDAMLFRARLKLFACVSGL